MRSLMTLFQVMCKKKHSISSLKQKTPESVIYGCASLFSSKFYTIRIFKAKKITFVCNRQIYRFFLHLIPKRCIHFLIFLKISGKNRKVFLLDKINFHRIKKKIEGYKPRMLYTLIAEANKFRLILYNSRFLPVQKHAANPETIDGIDFHRIVFQAHQRHSRCRASTIPSTIYSQSSIHRIVNYLLF